MIGRSFTLLQRYWPLRCKECAVSMIVRTKVNLTRLGHALCVFLSLALSMLPCASSLASAAPLAPQITCWPSSLWTWPSTASTTVLWNKSMEKRSTKYLWSMRALDSSALYLHSTSSPRKKSPQSLPPQFQERWTSPVSSWTSLTGMTFGIFLVLPESFLHSFAFSPSTKTWETSGGIPLGSFEAFAEGQHKGLLNILKKNNIIRVVWTFWRRTQSFEHSEKGHFNGLLTNSEEGEKLGSLEHSEEGGQNLKILTNNLMAVWQRATLQEKPEIYLYPSDYCHWLKRDNNIRESWWRQDDQHNLQENLERRFYPDLSNKELRILE